MIQYRFTRPGIYDLLGAMRKFFWLLILIFIAATAAGAEEPSYTVGVENIDLSPIYSVNPASQSYQGVIRDILDRFAASEKIRFVYVPLPIRRFQLEYWGGRLDFAFPDNPAWNPEPKRNLKIHYSEPVFSFQDAVLVAPSKLGQGIEQLKALGTVRGYTLWKFQSRVDQKKLRIVVAPSPESLVEMALTGHVEAINLPLQIANFHLRKFQHVGDLVPDPSLLPIQNSSYYFSTIRHPELIKKFDLFLKNEASTIRQIKKEKGF